MELFDYSSTGKCLYPIDVEQYGEFDFDNMKSKKDCEEFYGKQ